MRIHVEQLSTHLKKGLAPVYWVAGEEPFQHLQATDMIRSHARRMGYTDRQVFEIGVGFDWAQFENASASLSLFAERMLLELRLPSAKPGINGSKSLKSYAINPPTDQLLLISSGKLDRQAQNSAWFKALDKVGVVIQVWRLSAGETLTWVANRFREVGLETEHEAVRLLTARVEGNLMAASQEIEKIALLHGKGSLSTADVITDVNDNARFTVFNLADTVLAGDSAHALHILQTLKAEGVASTLVLWVLSDQLRTLAGMAFDLRREGSIESLLGPLWRRKKVLVQKALSRLSYDQCCGFLQRCAQIDKVIKGVEPGQEWDELIQLSIGVCGHEHLWSQSTV